jgi:hypothetical protein
VDSYSDLMSDNYRFYQQKATQARSRRHTDGPLAKQLQELFDVVRWCERVWAIEERIDRESGRR